ncbi:probable WRKY transcription factor 14 isoform X3 [Manihot esculenta]|uniref:Uncharacterized protein n=1 Tax=Manihot esculenta TaxID=3983 RepID=A0ACB7IEX5_MANES|nr:probable WRKY transcription factor 14 isoform X3 [Manihot esculenta]KAG8663602.1 hypothetical protein MANES_01G228500v8 [Manihot esculenta]
MVLLVLQLYTLKFQNSNHNLSHPKEGGCRKGDEKTVVTVRIGANAGKIKNEGPPSDFWSWRKYGQKPIKGSPYPRGYYRCSTSKGCSAKKQVERCRSDASMMIITYTSNHNHPGPDLHSTNLNPQTKDSQFPTQSTEDLRPATPKREQQEEENQSQNQATVVISHEDDKEGHNFHYLQSPTNCSQYMMISQEEPFSAEKTDDTLSILLDEEPISCPALMTPKSEENDFFDELEELPIYSAFTSFMRTNFYDEGIPAVPS